MSFPEKIAFLNAMNIYNMLHVSQNLGRSYRQTVAIHQMGHRMHMSDGDVGMQRFLTWHRIYLAFLEGDIRNLVDKNFLSHTGIGLKIQIYQSGLRTIYLLSVFQMQKQLLLQTLIMMLLFLGHLDRGILFQLKNKSTNFVIFMTIQILRGNSRRFIVMFTRM